MLGVDDAHLLDDVSAALVHQLARSGQASVLASVRSRTRVPDPIRALWKDDLATRLEVSALSQVQTREVLELALGGQVDGTTARRLWESAQGNMLLLREQVTAGLDRGALTDIGGVWRWEGPWVLAPGLVELITDRIGRLAPREQDVLEILALGEPIGAGLLTALADPRAVEAVESRSLVWARQDGRRVEVRLGHPLYGEVLRARCPGSRAGALRRALADALEASGARRKDDWMRIATWRLDAGAPVQPGALVAAARRAFALLDLGLAERLARTAFDATGDPDAGEVLWRVLFLGQRNAETEEAMTRLAVAPMSDAQRGEYAFGRAYNLFWGLHRIDEAVALLRSTREAIADPAWRDEIDLLQCVFQVLQAHLRPALQGLTALRDRAGLSPRAAAQVPVAQGMALVHVGRLAQARDVLDGAAEPLTRWTDELPWVAETRRMYRCYAALFAGRLAEAADLAGEFYAHATETDWEFPVRLACCLQAQVARLRGRVRAAASWAREGRRVYHRQPVSFFHNYVAGELAHAEALAGHAPEALAALAAADRDRTDTEALVQRWIELARPWVAVADGARERGVELALAAAGYARGQDAAGFEAFALHDAVRLGAATGVVDRLRELAGTVDGDLVGILAEHAAAAAAADAERIEAAAVALAGLGADLLAAEACGQAAELHGRIGHITDRRRLQGMAALLLDRCEGAQTPLAALVRPLGPDR